MEFEKRVYEPIHILNDEGLQEAKRLLDNDELVVIPTETVYGLGANALSQKAIFDIYRVKNRPLDNPLIIHIPDETHLEKYCEDIPETAYKLTRRFWPGPLTIVLKRKPVIPDFVTAGMDTVAVRCPDCEITHKLLTMVDYPVAAPSANLSGRPSTTSVAHVVEDLDTKVPAVLDGGDCMVGVESTIIDVTGEVPTLLRPGGITLEQLQDCLGEVQLDKALTQLLDEGEKPKAPGMKYRHYAPKAPVIAVKGAYAKTAAYIAQQAGPKDGVLCFEEYLPKMKAAVALSLGSEQNADQQAHLLFDALRRFDQHPELETIYAQTPSDKGIGLAVVNRLNKAAAFHIVEIE